MVIKTGHRYSNRADTEFMLISISITAFIFVLMVIEFYLNYLLSTRTNYIIGQMRLRFIDHLIHMPLAYYDTQQSGELMSRLTNDIHTVESAFTSKIVNLNSTLMGGAISIVVIFVMDWRMGIFSVSVGLLMGTTNAIFAPKFRHIAEQLQEKLAFLNSTLSNMLSGIRTIKLFNLYGQQKEQFGKDNANIYSLFIQQGKFEGRLAGLNLFLNYLSSVGILSFGILLSTYSDIGIGTVVAILFLQQSVTSTFLFTGNFVSDLQQSLVSTKRIFEVLDIPQEADHYSIQSDGQTVCDPNIVIHLKDICFRYKRSDYVLYGLDLSVREGEKVALVGPSGAGKSTIFKILMGFYSFESGSIAIFHKAIHQYSKEELRQQIAYVPQDPFLFHTTIEENIRYGNLNATRQDVIEAAERANIHAFIKTLPQGYDTVVNERSTNLSGGQRQRIAIARAFVKNAPILLLDEATSALDTESEKLIQHALEELMANRTTLIIAHRLTTVQKADKIFVVDEGKIVEEGSHKQLLGEKGRYQKLYLEH
ncbi:ABC transporter ATP-binding protein/permease [Lederbergia sp. NSJ-179]|uniref:ABC transporter ATP-binding protein n=1 Tax=Lederbergia sp. NSJ-179 TaxID=2931402 RepID=UPI001FD3B3BA|nr:ABC transporter ATP-binding protein/permease [Lederbergia sp. NSJ-179]